MNLRLLTLSCLLIFSIFLIPKNGLSQDNNAEFGYFKLITNVSNSYVIVDNKLDRIFELSRIDSIKLDPGKHHFFIIVKDAPDLETELVIEPGSTKKYFRNIVSFSKTNKSSYDRFKIGYNFTFITDPNSVIYLNDEKVGMGDYSGFLMNGKNSIRAVHPELGELKKNITITSYENSFLQRYNTKPKLLSTGYKWLPSVAYFAKGEKTKGAITLAGLGAAFTGIILQRNHFNDNKLKFDEATRNYNNSSNVFDVRKYSEEVVKYQDAMDSNNKNITLIAIAGALVYGVSTLDGIRKPKQGYKVSDTISIQPTFAQLPPNGANHYSLGFKMSLVR